MNIQYYDWSRFSREDSIIVELKWHLIKSKDSFRHSVFQKQKVFG